jgi:hypothetical protein
MIRSKIINGRKNGGALAYSEVDQTRIYFPFTQSAYFYTRSSVPLLHRTPHPLRHRRVLHTHHTLSCSLISPPPTTTELTMPGWGPDPADISDPKKVSSSEGEELYVCTEPPLPPICP